jgi:DNA-directed RNA polymerase subunit M/transcription elongation factor TFIIS
MSDDALIAAGWKPKKAENPNFKCRKCSSANVFYQVVESRSCGGFEDVNYHCFDCKSWWIESADA